jgi:hypothetical protein
MVNKENFQEAVLLLVTINFSYIKDSTDWKCGPQSLIFLKENKIKEEVIISSFYLWHVTITSSFPSTGSIISCLFFSLLALWT